MSIYGFVVCEAVGGALIALWLAVRKPEQGPDSFGRALLHCGTSLLLGSMAAPVTTQIVGTGFPAAAYFSAFVIILPSLIYVFLAWAWMVRVLQGALGRSRR